LGSKVARQLLAALLCRRRLSTSANVAQGSDRAFPIYFGNCASIILPAIVLLFSPEKVSLLSLPISAIGDN
jgi:hypothetical protein